LKLANSSFYSRARAIKTLTDAIVVIGFNTVKSLVLASVTRDLFKNFGLTEKLLWEHSLGVALAARTIAIRIRFPKAEEAFLSGLLHDIGKVIFLLKLPEKMQIIVQEVYNDPSIDFCRIEMETFGFNHAHVGQLLAQKWQFAEEIEEAIGKHHEPEESRSLPELTYIIHLANTLCHKLEIGPTKRPDLSLSEVESAKYLKIPEKTLDSLLEEIREAFLSDPDTLFS
jgi:putative nucleotidyltransferase with HDIG domain